MHSFSFQGGLVLDPISGLLPGLTIAEGLILDDAESSERPDLRRVDLDGYILLPGIIDLHGDGFERHLAPRRGAVPNVADGLVSLDAELAAAGITTAVLAQFWSWEGGMRAPEFARKLVAALADARPRLRTDMQVQLRVETHMLDDYPEIRAFLAENAIPYVVFNDHLPHQRLAEGRRPPRLTGQALKSGRNPEAHLALMTRLHKQTERVPAALAALAAELSDAGLHLGSHDDRTAEARASARAMGLRISEFPETQAAASAAKAAGDPIILGAPNVVRGASHAGNVSARELVAEGLCDALVSDYHYPSLRAAALHLAEGAGAALAPVWQLLSARPAEILGWGDRGRLLPGLRADLTVLEAETGQVTATFNRGGVSFLAGRFAERLLG